MTGHLIIVFSEIYRDERRAYTAVSNLLASTLNRFQVGILGRHGLGVGESLISLKFQTGWLLVLDILSEGWQMLVLPVSPRFHEEWLVWGGRDLHWLI